MQKDRLLLSSQTERQDTRLKLIDFAEGSTSPPRPAPRISARLKLIDFAEGSTAVDVAAVRQHGPPQTDRLCRRIDRFLREQLNTTGARLKLIDFAEGSTRSLSASITSSTRLKLIDFAEGSTSATGTAGAPRPPPQTDRLCRRIDRGGPSPGRKRAPPQTDRLCRRIDCKLLTCSASRARQTHCEHTRV